MEAGGGPGGFVAGQVFAGRYRMVTLLGQTETAHVWQAHDLVLQTDVALKVIPLVGNEDRDRILAEVRQTRRITHPAVRRIFDVGEADGMAFCSMELVRGEALGRLRKRVGRLPSERVAEIGEQLCEGLAAAHTHGVLHRDVRPENILIDEHGLVRLTDFAIHSPDGSNSITISNPYASPEQRSGGAVTEQSDLYSLGAVLYELLVGEMPTTDRPQRPSVTVADVDPHLERVILKALQKEPHRRPPSAMAMAAQLTSSASSRRRWSPWIAGAVLTLLVIGVAGLIAWLLPLREKRGAGALTDRDTIVIADFANMTGEEVFDGSMKVALAVALEQSPFLRIFPEERVRETLRLMQRPETEPVTRATARDIAQRERLKALVAGSVAKLGSMYVVTVEAVDAESGEVMGREQVQAAGKEEVLRSLGEATAHLRSTLGESLSLVRRFDAPLPQATTASLEALHAYSLGLEQWRINQSGDAIPHLQRALELDPEFALAQALLSGVYISTGRFAEAPAYSRRAFELRDRVSERERYVISWRYYIDAAQAWDKALELAQSWTKTYPREALAFNSLGMASAAFGDHDSAVAAFRKAIEIDPRFVPPFSNVAGSLVALGRFDQAQNAVDEARGRGVRATGIQRTAYVLAFIKGDTSSMARELSRARETEDVIWATTWEARVAAASGRFNAAHELFQSGIRSAIQSGFRDLAAQWSMEDAEAHALAGRCDDARREAANGLELGRDNFTLERASRAFALCGAGDQVARLTSELNKRFSDATLTRRVQIPIASAALALHGGQHARAVEILEPVRQFDFIPSAELWSAYLRSVAQLGAKDAAAARGGFEEVSTHRGVAPTSPLYPLARLGRARALVLGARAGEARAEYQAFLTLWADADPDLEPVTAAHREYARIK